MNADVVTENLTVLNRHIAHMAESAIQSATSSSSSSIPSSKSVEECGQLMSLWRPIMCRTSQMFPPPIPRSADPASTAPYHNSSEATPGSAVALLHNNNNNNNSGGGKTSKCDPSTPSPLSAPATNSKSIPVHCVVMNTTTPCYLSDAAMISSAGGVEGGAKAVDEVDVDSYAIIPASTLFTQIVPVVLRKLGYSDDVIFNATGWLMMKNWRPLSLTQIASSERETVGGVLGELTTVATLRIYIRKNYSSNGSHVNHQTEMKNKVLRWLMTQSQHLINSTRFPLDEWQQKVMRGERPNTPSPDARRQFDVWFQQEMLRPSPTQQQLILSRSSGDKIASHHSPVSNNDPRDAVISDMSRDVLPPRVRMRTTFDPEQELPRLQRWFSENQHPTRFQLQLYVQELNELESRRGRKPLDVSNLVYWFKNARAAFKRAEVRNNNQNESNADCWTGSGQSIQGCLGEESSDDNRRLDDDDLPAGSEDRGVAAEDDDDDHDDDDEDGCSSVSDRSRSYNHHHHHHHPQHPAPGATTLKMEPLDLNRSDDQVEKGDQLDGGDPTPPDPDDDDMGSQPSDSDSELEDYAENLSLSKHASDGMDGKKSDPLLHNTSGSSSQSDYAAAAAAYPGFPLSLSHAQLNPHGLVYMTSPYLQGIGSSLLHQSGSAAAAAAAAAAHHLHHHHRSGGGGGGIGAGGGLDPLSLTTAGGSSNNSDDRRKRNRTFIDPVTEVPRLEHWFSLNTHPSHSLVLRYTEELNRQPYRLKFPKLEPKNVQFWFKNRRAKCKRLKLSL